MSLLVSEPSFGKLAETIPRHWVNQSSCCGVTGSARIWAPNRNVPWGPTCKWPYHCISKGQDSSIDLFDGMNWSYGCKITTSTRIWVPDGNARTGPMVLRPCHCKPRGHCKVSIALEMEWIVPAVVKLQRPQELVCLTGMPGRARQLRST